MRRSAIVLAVLSVLSLCGCPGTGTSPAPDVPPARPGPLSFGQRPAKDAYQAIVATNTRFGLKLFHELRGRAPQENLVISPLSVGLALAMTCNGANGATRTGIAKALEVSGMPIEQVNRQYRDLLRAVRPADREVELRVANSLWAGKDFPFLRPFTRLTRDFYDAVAQNTDLRSPEGIRAVNAWMSKQSGGMIKEVVSVQDLGPPAGMVQLLLDVACFRAKWADPFSPSDTRPGRFTTLDNQQRQVPMMYKKGEFRYFATPELQAVLLPYSEGPLRFYVFLPASGGSLEQLCQSLTPQNWEAWVSRFTTHEGELRLPRFRVEGSLELKTALSQLGMASAFAGGQADFSQMCAGGVWLADVRHFTYLHVHEKGTEAAAAAFSTATAADGGDKFVMTVDHPFVCAIHDAETGAILFLGRIVDPQEG